MVASRTILAVFREVEVLCELGLCRDGSEVGVRLVRSPRGDAGVGI